MSTYLLLFLRSSFPYIIIYLAFRLFNSFYHKGSLKIFGIDVNKHKSKLAYLNFYLKEHFYFIISFLHIIFIIIIYYFELYYNNIIIMFFVCFYLFLGLNLYIKYILKKTDILDIKTINLVVNASLIILLGTCLSLIIESLNEHINFKINISDYLYNAIQRNDRLLLKYKRDPVGN
jgi:hypothetical protein